MKGKHTVHLSKSENNIKQVYWFITVCFLSIQTKSNGKLVYTKKKKKKKKKTSNFTAFIIEYFHSRIDLIKIKLNISVRGLKDRWLSIKSPAKPLVFFIWLTTDSYFKLLHTEIVSLWIKTILIFSQLKALSPITFEIFIGDLFGPLQRVRDKKIL